MQTATNEKPILFNGEMVRAILSGRKTQTRRIVKPQPPGYIDELHGNDLRGRAPYRIEHYETGCILGSGFEDDDNVLYRCPFGVPGDRLWVRESFRFTCDEKSFSCVAYEADGTARQMLCLDGGDGDPIGVGKACRPAIFESLKWRPSIHMPRWASRITLKVTDVRVQRVQDISEEDAIAEGCQCAGVPASLTNRGAFAKLWDSINAKDGNGWAANPWVWAVTFKRAKP